MAAFQVAFNPTTKVATIQTKGAAVPSGSTKSGEFNHDDAALDNLGKPLGENHVFFHHVRDILYKIGHFDMQIVKIVKP